MARTDRPRTGRTGRKRFGSALLAALMAALCAGPLAAQGLAQDGGLAEALQNAPDLPSDLLEGGAQTQQELERAGDGSGDDQNNREQGNGDGARDGAADERSAGAGPAPMSRLERFYSERADRQLRLQGYDFLRGRALQTAGSGGALQDQYVLKTGDRLRVNFHGQRDETHEVVVDADGNISLPVFGPISAAGRELGAVRAELAAETDEAFLETDVYVALINIDQVPVAISGHVAQAGQRRVPALSDVANALRAAGGAQRSGSLRRITLRRDGQRRTVDLYGSLLGEAAESDEASADGTATLRPGDQLHVPAVGPTVAVAGFVARDGIYELPPGADSVSAEQALAWAGGALAPEEMRATVLTLRGDGTETSRRLDDLAQADLGDGDILLIQRQRDERDDTVEIVGGGDALAGFYPLDEAGTVAEAIGDAGRLGDDVYRPLAVLERRDPATGARQFEAVDLMAELAGEATTELQARDRLILLHRRHVAFLNGRAVRRALTDGLAQALAGRRGGSNGASGGDASSGSAGDGSANGGAGDGETGDDGDGATPADAGRQGQRCAPLAAIARLQQSQSTRLADSAMMRALDSVGAKQTTRCPDLFAANPGLAVFLVQEATVVTGPVADPGLYPIADEPELAELVALAGGLIGGADRANVRRRRTSRVAGDSDGFAAGSIWALSGPAVRVTGAVREPGRRFLSADGATVGDVIDDRGDLGDNAYPFFAVIERRESGGFARDTVAFSPRAVLAGEADPALSDGDRVRFFDRNEVYFESRRPGDGSGADESGSDDGQARNEGQAGDPRAGAAEASENAGPDEDAQEAAAQALARRAAQSGESDQRDDLAQLLAQRRQNNASGNSGDRSEAQQADASEAFTPAVRAALRSHLVALHGAVIEPGFYPLARAVPVQDLFDLLEGPKAEADLTRVEYTSFTLTEAAEVRRSGARRFVDLSTASARRSLHLAPREGLFLSPVFSDNLDASVRVTGEVRHPGSYQLLRGDRLLDLVERAGGYTEQAYVPGAVFLRESVREARQEAFRQAARDLQRELAGIATSGREGAQNINVEAVRTLAADLRSAEAQGRIVIDARREALEENREKNILLQAGDRLHMPSRPAHVTVSGEVLSPASLQYTDDKVAQDYIAESGGLTDFADTQRIFMVTPAGRARTLEAEIFAYERPEIRPGSRIIVPREVLPFDAQRFTSTISNIMRDLAVSTSTARQISE